jgi:hypothetical protein
MTLESFVRALSPFDTIPDELLSRIFTIGCEMDLDRLCINYRKEDIGLCIGMTDRSPLLLLRPVVQYAEDGIKLFVPGAMRTCGVFLQHLTTSTGITISGLRGVPGG